MRFHKKTSATLLAAAIVMSLPISAALAQGEGDYDLPGAMAEFWASEAGQDLIAEYTVDPSQSTTSDPEGDFEFSTGEPPGLPPTGDLDITGTRTFMFNPPTDINGSFFDIQIEGGIFCETDPFNPVIPDVRTICPPGGFDPAAFDNGAIVSVIETAEPFGFFNLSITCEWVMWYRQPGAPVWENRPQFPLDPAGGTNVARGLRIGQQESGPINLMLSDGGFFEPMPADTLVAIGQNQIAFFTPAPALGMPDAARAYTFCTEGGFQASDSVADSTDLGEIQLATIELQLVGSEPVVVVTTTTTVPPTTTTTTTSTTTSLVIAEGANSEGGSFSQTIWIPILIGTVVVVVGIVLYWRTRERGKDGGGGGAPGRPGRPEQPGAAPPPIASSVDDGSHGVCDWALYFLDAGVRTVLRPAQGHECCVYDVEIDTAIFDHDEAAKGRQDAESPHVEGASPDERLRIPDLGFGYGGAGFWGWASARSGPAGRLDWTQGLGDPRQKAGRDVDSRFDSQLHQQRTLEEGPELAAHLTHLEYTTVKATLDAGCPDHENTYSLGGTSTVTVQATQECTNNAPGPECPNELTAAAWVEGILVGDLNYSTTEMAHSDVDEIEPLTERLRQAMERDTPVAMTDSHDHATRPRDSYESSRTGSGANVVKNDSFGITVLSGITADAGTIVPVATWPHTERVTADIFAELGHDISVDAHMDRGDCGPTACNGHGDCLCNPAFTLRMGGNSGRLTVDGKTYDVIRPTPDGTWRLA